MRFEKFLLDNYMATEEGRRVLHIFKNLYSYIDAGDRDGTIIDFINSLLYKPIAKDFFTFESLKEPIETGELEYPPFSEFEAWMYQYFEDIKNNWQCSHREMLWEIPRLSVLEFFRFAPAYAFPYLYPVHFNILQSIFEEFNIPLPPLSGTKQHESRCYYYVELCKALYEFRQTHGMTPQELCVFLYGFAPLFVARNLSDTLPQPSSAWIMGPNLQQTRKTQVIQKDTVESWHGNLINVRRGDIILTYEFAPKSAITCVWHALTDGYEEHFGAYPANIWIGKPCKVPDTTLNDFKKCSVLRESSLVKANMLHVGGGYLLKNVEYNAIFLLFQEKGFDTALLPELLSHNLDLDAEILNERDVEEHLLEPFLVKLGIHENHITRQMPLRMGRGVRYYPDYVINAKSDRGEERGAFVWEAKYRITSQKQMLEDFYQAKSYALRLNTNGLGLVSYEGIWVSFKSDAWDIKKIQHVKWVDLKNPDTFGQISIALKKAFGKL